MRQPSFLLDFLRITFFARFITVIYDFFTGAGAFPFVFVLHIADGTAIRIMEFFRVCVENICLSMRASAVVFRRLLNFLCC